MFTQKDELQIARQGLTPEKVSLQIHNYETGFPFLQVVEAATTSKGVMKPSEKDIERFVNIYENETAHGLSAIKFVPASGAASRMFKSLYSALDALNLGKSAKEVLDENADAAFFFSNLTKFAFFKPLKACIENDNQEVTFENTLQYLLSGKGLDYGNLPKGLLLFHHYNDSMRTSFEEHLVEGALYAKNAKGVVNLHFTVSKEHENLFRQLLGKVKSAYENMFDVTFEVEFSNQQSSTDIIAADMNNRPFRESDGSLLFRPGGHGALLENLNNLGNDLIFIKNIDNVVPDKLKQPTITSKKALAGILIHYQKRIFSFQKELNEKHFSALSSAFLAAAAQFLENELHTRPAADLYYEEKESLCRYLKSKFNRPIRVCGVVKNEGEPGGGPFFALSCDGSVSLQIAENAQIDNSDIRQAQIAAGAEFFNPVDLVCGVKNYRGEKFNLPDFSDPKTGFISQKSKDGRELKAQELPGLWNGAMSDWNTILVDAPIETFNPVKTVNDLLRKQHQ